MKKKSAVVLLSGGMDSTTCLAMAAHEYSVVALSFDYGQRNAYELRCATIQACGVPLREHLRVKLDLRPIGGSALLGSAEVPKSESVEDLDDSIPITYVSARNAIFLMYALAVAEMRGIHDIFIGVNAVDFSGYPDCRPEFLKSFEALAKLATKAGVEGKSFRVHAPLLHLSKGEIIQKGTALGVKYENTMSCYDPNSFGKSCGFCASCLLRAKGFADAGLPDPALMDVVV